MKFLILALALACAYADVSHLSPKSADADAPIIRSDFDNNPDGSFQYNYETGNGIVSQAQGAVKNANSDSPALEVQGTFRYISPDGTPVEISYTANENGFQPQGSHIPVGPEIPEAIVRSLAYNAAHPQQPDSVVIQPARNTYRP